jgi:hypothetical protein
MSMNSFDLTIPVFSKALAQQLKWLDAAAALATAKKFEVDTLVNARLAPDQYPFAKQIQASCDTAKFTCARLAGKEAPAHPDTETTIEELRARLRSVLGYLETFKASDFDGAADRKVVLPWANGQWMKGTDYLTQLQIPNFFFHVTTAYAILRHNGVELGKRDFIGHIDLHS